MDLCMSLKGSKFVLYADFSAHKFKISYLLKVKFGTMKNTLCPNPRYRVHIKL